MRILAPYGVTATITTSLTCPLVIGGTAANSTLTLESTSGVGTTDAILFNTGSQVEAMRINTSGQVGIGVTPTQFVHVRKDQDTTTNAYFENQSTGTSALTQVYIANTGNYFMGLRQYGQNTSGTLAGLNKAGLSAIVAGSSSTALLIETTTNTTPIHLAVGGVITSTVTTTGLGIFTSSPSTALGFGGNSARTIALERHTTANTAGNALTVQAGSATSAAADKAGGTLSLIGGISTGAGLSKVQTLVYGIIAASTTDNAQIRTQFSQAWSDSGVDRACTFFDGMVQFNNQVTAYTTDVTVGTTARMYGTASTGGSYPFTAAGHFVIQARPDASRDIIVATGTTPAARMVLTGGGKIGLLGVTVPTNDVSLDGQSARTLWMERHTTANTAGNNLTVQSGGATSGATDKAGGNLILSPGASTGTGRNNTVNIKGYSPATASGTGDNTQVDRQMIGCFAAITNGVSNVVSVTVASGSAVGGSIKYTLIDTDGTDWQSETGLVNFASANKAGTISSAISAIGLEAKVATGVSTIIPVWAITNANPAVISVNPVSSLTSSTGYPRIVFTLENFGGQAVALV